MKVKLNLITILFIFIHCMTVHAQYLQWEKRYFGTTSGSAGSTSITVDNAGNCYVTGTNSDNRIATVKYNSSGTQEWAVVFNEQNVPSYSYSITKAEVGTSTLIYVCGAVSTSVNGTDYVAICYNSSGVQQWRAFYDGVGGNDYAIDVDADGNGNCYVTGRSYNGTDDDYVTIKYNSTGVPLWTKNYDNEGNDMAYAVKADLNGNAFVTGKSQSGIFGNDDIATIRYNSSDGSVGSGWPQRYNGSYNGTDIGYDIAVYSNNFVFVTGMSTEGASDTRETTIRYSTSGVQTWVANNLYGVGKSIGIYKRLISAGPHGPSSYTIDCFVTGNDRNDGNPTWHAQTIYYTLSGAQQWVATYSEVYSDFVSLTIDNSENIYVTGSGSISGGDDQKYITTKYKFNGSMDWSVDYNNGVNSFARGVGVWNNGTGTTYTYVTGASRDPSTNFYTYLTIEYGPPPGGGNPVGNQQLTPGDIPREFILNQNYPNPFNPSTTISYSIPNGSDVRLTMYDYLGRELRTLIAQYQPAGNYNLHFDASTLASGFYFYRLQAGAYSDIKKMTLIR